MTRRAVMLTVTLFALSAATLTAQPQLLPQPQMQKLANRFPPATEATLRTLVDSAHRMGIPAEPLVQRALEGASHGADPARVVAAVRGLVNRLDVARQALGTSATEAELLAASGALYLGIPPDTLVRLRRRHASGGLALPLVVLADMIRQGVPKDTATAVILSLSDAGVADESYRALRQAVLLDIRSGVPPATAAAMRARDVLLARAARTAGSGRPAPVRPPLD